MKSSIFCRKRGDVRTNRVYKIIEIHGWIKGCSAKYLHGLLLINCTSYSLLTAADVRCAVANTRKRANWRMCCMVSEESHCSSEKQYTLN